MCGPVGAADAVQSRADGGYRLAVNRGVDRRQRAPFLGGDVVHLDRREYAGRFLATDRHDSAVDEGGAVAPAWCGHVWQLVPIPRGRVEPLEGCRVLVGAQRAPTQRVHIDTV